MLTAEEKKENWDFFIENYTKRNIRWYPRKHKKEIDGEIEKMLIAGYSYDEICPALHVGNNRVSAIMMKLRRRGKL